MPFPQIRAAVVVLMVSSLLLPISGALPAAANETKSSQVSALPQLKYGDKNAAVKRLQVLLGVNPISGGFFNKTKNAVIDLQKKSKLKTSGIVDQKTWSALGINSTKELQKVPTKVIDVPATPTETVVIDKTLPTLKFEDKNENVKRLQVLLGVTPVTGGFFTKTKAAVETAQKTSGLKVTGVVTPELWAALGISTSAKLAELPTSPVVEPTNEEPLPTTDPGVIPQPETPPVVAPTIKTPNPIADTVAFDAAGEYQSQVICDPSPKIGADRLRALLKEVYGETVIGIYRDCANGGTSEHKEGRALDWMYHWRNLEQRAKVESFLSWLIAPGADGRPGANARRMGVMYVLWDGRIWGIYRADEGWRDIGGCTTDPQKKSSSYDNYCHRDHVHMSMTWDGAAGLTSYWNPNPQTLAVCEESPSAIAPTAVIDPQQLTAITPIRILDTKTGLGVSQPCRLGGRRSTLDTRYLAIPIMKPIEVVLEAEDTALLPPLVTPLPPATPVLIPGLPSTGVAAVLVRATVSNSNAPSSLSVYARGTTRPNIATVPVNMNGSASAETIVPVGTDGAISVAVATGAAEVALDVIGYFANPPQTLANTPRSTIRLNSSALLDVKTPIKPGETRSLALPKSEVGEAPEAASVVITVSAKGAGRVLVFSGDVVQLAVNYNSTADAVLSLRGNRTLTFVNEGNAAVELKVHSNWFLGPNPEGGMNGIVPIRPISALTNTTIKSDKIVSVPLSKLVTIPPQAKVVLVSVTVRKRSAAQGVFVWGATRPLTANIGIPDNNPRTSLAFVAIDELRSLQVLANSGSADVSLAIIGWGD